MLDVPNTVATLVAHLTCPRCDQGYVVITRVDRCYRRAWRVWRIQCTACPAGPRAWRKTARAAALLWNDWCLRQMPAAQPARPALRIIR